MTRRKSSKSEPELRPDMEVEATQGDLGEDDVSQPRVKEVVQNRQGQSDHLVMQKGVLFRKTLDIPLERVDQVQVPQTPEEKGKVVVQVGQEEAEKLAAQKSETLPPQSEEAMADRRSAKEKDQEPSALSWWRILGPGFLSGMAGNDASAVGAYSIDGSQVGYQHLWLMLLSTPLYQAVQYTCAKIGRLTGQGLAEVLRTHYNRPLAIFASCILVLANLALITADLVAISTGLELLTHLSWVWFVAPVAVIIWYLIVYQGFGLLKKIFIGMSLAFLVYVLTAIFSHPDGGVLLWNTLVPHVDFSFGSVSSAVALLGATISPYTMYWQVKAEREEKRPGNTKRKQMRFAAFDILLGALGGNLIAYCIMLTAAATFFPHHKSIRTVVDAALALAPLLGPFAKYLFAIGFIGAGLVALPVLLASTSYAVAGTVGWPGALSKKPWQNEGFYLILSGALLLSLLLALLRLDPIWLIFWANVLNGVLSPVLMLFLLLVGNSARVMRQQKISWLTNVGLCLALVLMTTAAGLLLYGLFTGQGTG